MNGQIEILCEPMKGERGRDRYEGGRESGVGRQ